jgi:hypothetical protein
MKVKTYAILERAIEEGIAYGYTRAFKHTDSPSEDSIKNEILNSVMNSINEVIEFDEPTVSDRVSDSQVYLQEYRSVL